MQRNLTSFHTKAMKIHLPHIAYTVHVKAFKPHLELQNAKAYCQREDQNSCTLFLPKRNSPPDLAHELMHVIQFIVLDRNLKFELEQEHTAYIMGHLMGTIMGYEYNV